MERDRETRCFRSTSVSPFFFPRQGEARRGDDGDDDDVRCNFPRGASERVVYFSAPVRQPFPLFLPVCVYVCVGERCCCG